MQPSTGIPPRYISLTRGKEAIVDDEDYDYLNQWKWSCSSLGYALRGEYDKETKKVNPVRMHRVIMNAPKSFQVDHINGNKLDNRKANLRFATNAQNIANGKLTSRNKSGAKGVHWHNRDKRWVAKIGVNNKRVWLGYYQDKNEAIKAYNDAALKYHGEFARLNEVEV